MFCTLGEFPNNAQKDAQNREPCHVFSADSTYTSKFKHRCRPTKAAKLACKVSAAVVAPSCPELRCISIGSIHGPSQLLRPKGTFPGCKCPLDSPPLLRFDLNPCLAYRFSWLTSRGHSNPEQPRMKFCHLSGLWTEGTLVPHRDLRAFV